MKRRRTSLAIVLAIAATWALILGAAGQEDVYSERTMELARQLQCPVCAGQSVADSQVTLAQQMRDTIERQVQAGQSDEQIIAYFVERYDNVLLEPPKSGFLLTLWWIPPAVLAVGALVVVLYIREGTGRKRGSKTPDPYDDLPDEELEALARTFMRPDTPPRSS